MKSFYEINKAYDSVPEPERFGIAMVVGVITLILIRIIPVLGFLTAGFLIGVRVRYLYGSAQPR